MSRVDNENIFNYLEEFTFNRDKTIIQEFMFNDVIVPRFINEFWTSEQRKASSIHEISYRACFKPQLPNFFIKLLTKEEDIVYDPFSGRGTTSIEAGLENRNFIANDINNLSDLISRPRFFIPSLDEVIERLESIEYDYSVKADIDLSMFFHPKTESEIVCLKNYLTNGQQNRANENIDSWIRMVATNRLTGHSPGFFSVYTLPPNQAVTQESQIKINLKRNQQPDYRDTKKLIIKKTKTLLKNLTIEQINTLRAKGEKGIFLSKDARETCEINSDSVQLTVTSPPFLNIVQYSTDNWLRCWFNNIDDKQISKKITMAKTVEEWSSIMFSVFKELFRITKRGGWVAFEVGEVNNGKINLDEYIVPIGIEVGFKCEGILINEQNFTKTSNIWGINNNKSGTNTNRIIMFKKQF